VLYSRSSMRVRVFHRHHGIPQRAGCVSTDHHTLCTLRCWAAAALDSHLRGDPITTIPDAPAWAWQHLATHDRVATSLVVACTASSLPVPDALRQHALRDGQQRLLLLARLHEVTAIAAGVGIPVLLLKGTADLGEPLLSPSGDLDLFVRLEQLRPLADALVRAGWSAPDWQRRASKPGVTLSRDHDPVPVDLHAVWFNMREDTGREVWDAPVAIPSLPGHHRPATRLQTWHLLLHGALQHPERRGCLRDTLRLHRLVHGCSTEDRAWIQAEVATHPDRDVLADEWSRLVASVASHATTNGAELAAWTREALSRRRIRWARLHSHYQLLLFGMTGHRGLLWHLARRIATPNRLLPTGQRMSRARRAEHALRRMIRVALALALLPVAYGDMAAMRRRLA
jgi:hypothetical protein